MIERRRPQIAEEFLHDLAGVVAILEPRDRRFEIAGIGEPVGAERPEIGEPEQVAVILRDIAARASIRRSEEPTSELQSLERNSYAVFCLTKTTKPENKKRT